MISNLLGDRWISADLEVGDTVLVHSSIKRTLMEYRRKGILVTPQDILESFLRVIGSRGTLILPLFNFEFTKGIPFDIRTTESQMGALTVVGRNHPKAVRTGHPIYSFAAIGHYASEFEKIDNKSGYGQDSPFGMLMTLNGKIACLDLEDQQSMTFYHHIEEMKRVDYRYFKSFSGDYTDKIGRTQKKTYTLYVRDVDRKVLTNVNPAGELLWEAGLYKGSRPGEGAGLRLIRARDMYTFVEDLIDNGRAFGSLYSIGADL